eukprot:gnl/Dysnectes_brevis/542_a599_5111.p1 GENE.gnl/Dysnectes_brevis/542_a599_5111~~gnl/Dysnectes_brevis/542_a599_5111.p1  ORF type:complete len:441 (-),score=192.77 gnl/Dysnectes_brevis/542_a599_5111:139-1461(-)
MISKPMSEEKKELNYEDLLLGEADEEEKPEAQEAKEDVNEDEVLKKTTFGAAHNVSFNEFLLKDGLLRSIQDNGFENPSAVQNEVLPSSLMGFDIICQAKSGRGKTAVFVFSILQQLKPKPGQVQALVICNTRELAVQISREFERFSTHLAHVKTLSVYGKVPIAVHRAALRAGDVSIVVGTPGRLGALVDDGTLKLDKLNFFVIDECDKVLMNESMRETVDKLIPLMDKEKQTMLFTATLDDDSKMMCRKYVTEQKEVLIDDSKLVLHGLKQHWVKLTEEEKLPALARLLSESSFNQLIVFVKSVARANALKTYLVEHAHPCFAIHGRLDQAVRTDLYMRFKRFDIRIMVATDIFERGVDFENVNFVVNFDMPAKSDTYLHRAGRAGRFGTAGTVLSMVSSEEDTGVLTEIQERFIVDIPEATVDTIIVEMNAGKDKDQ